jgi:hypothetical protein
MLQELACEDLLRSFVWGDRVSTQEVTMTLPRERYSPQFPSMS